MGDIQAEYPRWHIGDTPFKGWGIHAAHAPSPNLMKYISGKILAIFLSIPVIAIESWPATVALIAALLLWAMEEYLQGRTQSVEETYKKRIAELEDRINMIETSMQLRRWYAFFTLLLALQIPAASIVAGELCVT